MSLRNILIPRCRAAAVTTKDGNTITHYCEHPFGHDGDHGARTPSGAAWLSWSHLTQQSMVIPPLPQSGFRFPGQDRQHAHSRHPKEEWLYSCCACSGLYDPGCPACVAGP